MDIISNGRSPHGECGLKYFFCHFFSAIEQSLPAWGVWIEIPGIKQSVKINLRRSPHGECGLKSTSRHILKPKVWSLPAWGVWIEIQTYHKYIPPCKSLPAWGVWIEINEAGEIGVIIQVAPRMGSVD